MPHMPYTWGQQQKDDLQVATPVDADEDGVDNLEEGLPPPLVSLPPPLSSVRIELARCLRDGKVKSDPAQVHKQFEELDIDHNGTLALDEVERFVTQTLGYSPSADFLSGVFAAFDQDGNGSLSEDEFGKMLKVLRTHTGTQQEEQQQP
jgi:hypothetical protein